MNNDNKIVRAITSVACVMIIAKALAMVRNILQARVFGAGADIDLFTLANNYSISLFTTICYALCVAAIPLFTQKLMKSREETFRSADRLISNTLVLSCGLLVLLYVILYTGGTEQLLGVEDNTGLFRRCLAMLLPTLPIITLTYLLLSLFQSMGHFTLQGSLSLLYNVLLCGVLVLADKRLSLLTFTILVSIGWLLQLAMAIPYIRKEKYRFHFSPDFRQKDYWNFLRTAVITAFNSSLFLFCYLINTRFSAGTAEGTVSALYYADRLYEPLTITLIYSVSIVLFPKFSQQHEQMDAPQYHQYVVYVLKNTLLLVLPISLLFCSFGTPIIRVLFEGGSFTYADSILCGKIFSMYALGMAGFFMLDILNKAYYAMGKTLVPTCVTAAVVVVTLILNIACAHFAPDQPHLLALSTSLAFLLGSSILYVGFARSERVKLPRKQLFFGVVFSLLIWLGSRLAYSSLIPTDASKPALVAQCIGIGVVAMILYLILMGPMVPTYEILRKLGVKKR